MRSRHSAVLTLAGALIAGLAWGTESGAAKAVLMPIQDRVGNPEYAALTRDLLRDEISKTYVLTEVTDLRRVLRSLRIRHITSEPPLRLSALGQELGIEWFFTATLHQAVDDSVPQVILSAKLFKAGSDELRWAGFEAATGLDAESWLGLGRVESLADLIGVVVRRLVAKIPSEGTITRQDSARPVKGSFLRQRVSPDAEARLAVIPFDSISDSLPMAAAEIATDAMFASLSEFGYSLLLPGFVRSVLLEENLLYLGEVSRPGWEALAARGGATWIVTGTVETFQIGLGAEPRPWVAIGSRLIDATTGQIGWMGGLEKTGESTGTVFDRGRRYSAGSLAHEMMLAFTASFTGDPASL